MVDKYISHTATYGGNDVVVKKALITSLFAF